MTNVFKEQVNDLDKQLPNFKIASAIIHYDETSPHLHLVGISIKYKNGMKKQVGKDKERKEYWIFSKAYTSMNILRLNN